MKLPTNTSISMCALLLAFTAGRSGPIYGEDPLNTARRIIDGIGGAAGAYRQSQRAAQGPGPARLPPPPDGRLNTVNPTASGGVDILIAEKPYDAARLIKNQGGMITIAHKTGVAKFKIADLSDEDLSVISIVFGVELNKAVPPPESKDAPQLSPSSVPVAPRAAYVSSLEPSSVVTDHHEEIDVLEKAAASGDARSAAILSICYRSGFLVPTNADKALSYAFKAEAAENPLGMFALGRCYGDGRGLIQDKQKEIALISKARPGLEKSAETDDPWAQYALAYCWDGGIGTIKDPRKAVEWYEKAAAQGNAIAQNNLGLCFANGTGVTKDERKAVEWYEKAAVQGFATAQTILGLCFANGTGVTKDERKAVEWYEKAATQGYANAQNNLGICFERGTGVAKDGRKAVEWFEKAAAQGLADAENNMGHCLLNGIGVTANKSKAVEWFQKAAAHGSTFAPKNLARLGIQVKAPVPLQTGTDAPAATTSNETDSFGGKTLRGEKKEGPAIKGLQLGMHITEARDALLAQMGKPLAMNFRVVEYDDGYGIRGTSNGPAEPDDLGSVLDKLNTLGPNMIISGLSDIESSLNGGKNSYVPGVDEVYVFAGKDGMVKSIGFSPFVVGKLFSEVADLPIEEFSLQFANAYRLPFMNLSFNEQAGAVYQCITSDGVAITIEQKMETMKGIFIQKKDVRGKKGFN